MDALRAAGAHQLIATPRAHETLQAGQVPLDALVRSGHDPGERDAGEALDPPPRVVVSTAGEHGGEWRDENRVQRRWEASVLPGPRRDAYGAGDAFAAGLTFGLAAGWAVTDAVRLGARCGAHKLCGRAAYENQLTAAEL